jgi:hypothetical protein
MLRTSMFINVFICVTIVTITTISWVVTTEITFPPGTAIKIDRLKVYFHGRHRSAVVNSIFSSQGYMLHICSLNLLSTYGGNYSKFYLSDDNQYAINNSYQYITINLSTCRITGYRHPYRGSTSFILGEKGHPSLPKLMIGHNNTDQRMDSDFYYIAG